MTERTRPVVSGRSSGVTRTASRILHRAQTFGLIPPEVKAIRDEPLAPERKRHRPSDMGEEAKAKMRARRNVNKKQVNDSWTALVKCIIYLGGNYW